MPLYVFKCVSCGKEVELLQKFDDLPPICCGDQKMTRQIGSKISVQFKGTGFYETDYKGKK